LIFPFGCIFIFIFTLRHRGTKKARPKSGRSKNAAVPPEFRRAAPALFLTYNGAAVKGYRRTVIRRFDPSCSEAKRPKRANDRFQPWRSLF